MDGSGLIRLADKLSGTSVIASSDWGPRDSLARGDLQSRGIRRSEEVHTGLLALPILTREHTRVPDFPGVGGNASGNGLVVSSQPGAPRTGHTGTDRRMAGWLAR